MDTQLITLFAAHLDEASSAKHKYNSGINNKAWKTMPLVLCSENKPEIQSILRTLLPRPAGEEEEDEDDSPKLSSKPLVLWFEEREQCDKDGFASEIRLRSNTMREIVSILVANGGPEVYDARVRVALKKTARELKLNWKRDIAPFENVAFSTRIIKEIERVEQQQQSSTTTSSSWDFFRIAKVVTAGVVGGTVIGLSGGLAAPVLAPAFATMFATTAAISAGLISGMFGILGAGLASYKMTTRTDSTLTEFAFLECNSSTEATAAVPACVNVLVGVSGSYPAQSVDDQLKLFWASEEEEARFGGSSVFALKYETQAILNYSYTLSELIKNQAISYTGNELLKLVIGATVMLPISLMQNLDLISNSFAVCETKSIAAGKELASALQSRYQGHRPVTLCGFGFGALVVFSCLERLRELGCEGIVENAVLVGLPLRAREHRWELAQSIVAGDIFNCYCTSDWALQLAMRAGVSLGTVAGVQPINGVDGVVNIQVDTPHFKLGMDGGVEMRKLLRHLNL